MYSPYAVDTYPIIEVTKYALQKELSTFGKVACSETESATQTFFRNVDTESLLQPVPNFK